MFVKLTNQQPLSQFIKLIATFIPIILPLRCFELILILVISFHLPRLQLLAEQHYLKQRLEYLHCFLVILCHLGIINFRFNHFQLEFMLSYRCHRQSQIIIAELPMHSSLQVNQQSQLLLSIKLFIKVQSIKGQFILVFLPLILFILELFRLRIIDELTSVLPKLKMNFDLELFVPILFQSMELLPKSYVFQHSTAFFSYNIISLELIFHQIPFTQIFLFIWFSRPIFYFQKSSFISCPPIFYFWHFCSLFYLKLQNPLVFKQIFYPSSILFYFYSQFSFHLQSLNHPFRFQFFYLLYQKIQPFCPIIFWVFILIDLFQESHFFQFILFSFYLSMICKQFLSILTSFFIILASHSQ